MDQGRFKPGIASGRLNAEELAENFSDLHPPLDHHEAAVEADRCYFCHDAPCVTACPTDIDIPLFIRQISTGDVKGSARTIFEQNILGGMCARVCPTETLCEQVCVREEAEGKPVRIGMLQRHATDAAMADAQHPFTRTSSTGKTIGVVGAGPAGLACAHRLAMHGHDVVIYDGREKSGGLNEYGIAQYKTVDGFAQAEVDWLLQIGGIEIRHGARLGDDLSLDGLLETHDAVFLGIGKSSARALDVPGADLDGVQDALSFIADLRQSDEFKSVPIGRDIVVIGGGMTAIDAAIQSKLLGAQNVTIVYRRTQDKMNASGYEQELATARGVRIICEAQPVAFSGSGKVEAAEFAYSVEQNGTLVSLDEAITIPADQVLIAIGQQLDGDGFGLKQDSGALWTNEDGQTSNSRVWAGGDCTATGDDLTVTAVAQGRDAAEDIHRKLTGENDG